MRGRLVESLASQRACLCMFCRIAPCKQGKAVQLRPVRSTAAANAEVHCKDLLQLWLKSCSALSTHILSLSLQVPSRKLIMVAAEQVLGPDGVHGQHQPGGADHGGAPPEPGLQPRDVLLPRRHAPPVRRATHATLISGELMLWSSLTHGGWKHSISRLTVPAYSMQL